MPYTSFKDLVNLATQSNLFALWKPQGKCDALHQDSTPLPLLIICALWYLGCGWMFDDLSKNTGISKEVIRIFLHQFILFGSTELYKMFVVTPTRGKMLPITQKSIDKLVIMAVWAQQMQPIFFWSKVEYCCLQQNHLGSRQHIQPVPTT